MDSFERGFCRRRKYFAPRDSRLISSIRSPDHSANQPCIHSFMHLVNISLSWLDKSVPPPSSISAKGFKWIKALNVIWVPDNASRVLECHESI